MVQLLAVTGDNASPNNMMIDYLSDMILSFSGQRARVRCFDHITNLVAKTLLKLFEKKKGSRGMLTPVRTEAILMILTEMEMGKMKKQTVMKLGKRLQLGSAKKSCKSLKKASNLSVACLRRWVKKQ